MRRIIERLAAHCCDVAASAWRRATRAPGALHRPDAPLRIPALVAPEHSAWMIATELARHTAPRHRHRRRPAGKGRRAVIAAR